MARTISNGDDIIDSRDVIARIAELESERDDIEHAPADDESALTLEEFDTGDDGQELKTLRALAEECEGYVSDWRHGEALIRDSYFEDYARQLAEDIGAINRDARWPNDCIDWEKAADELRQDYTSVDFDGITYWVRS